MLSLKARSAAPAIIFLDEIDCIAGSGRGGIPGSSASSANADARSAEARVLSAFAFNAYQVPVWDLMAPVFALIQLSLSLSLDLYVLRMCGLHLLSGSFFLLVISFHSTFFLAPSLSPFLSVLSFSLSLSLSLSPFLSVLPFFLSLSLSLFLPFCLTFLSFSLSLSLSLFLSPLFSCSLFLSSNRYVIE